MDGGGDSWIRMDFGDWLVTRSQDSDSVNGILPPPSLSSDILPPLPSAFSPSFPSNPPNLFGSPSSLPPTPSVPPTTKASPTPIKKGYGKGEEGMDKFVQKWTDFLKFQIRKLAKFDGQKMKVQ